MDKALNILVIVAGGKKHLDPFINAGRKLGLNVTTASFTDINYLTNDNKVDFSIKGRKLTEFDICYIRLAGKRYEDVALLVDELKKNKIKIIDQIYDNMASIRLPLAKSLEAKILIEKGFPVPKTYFGTLNDIFTSSKEYFGYPYVVKSTTGKQGNAVWSPRNEVEEKRLYENLSKIIKKGDRFISQEFIMAGQRDRIFVIGGKVVGGFTRPTRWRRRFVERVNGNIPEGKRTKLDPIPENEANLALSAAKSLSIDIAGVDILKEDNSGKLYILEVNSAPRWESLKKDTGIYIEEEILKYLSSV